MEIKNKTIIVTGAARVGKRVALALGEHGANLVLSYQHSKDTIEQLCQESREMGSKAVAVHADLSNEESIASLVREAKAAFGHIDGLVHMASIYEKTPWNTLTAQDWDRNMDIMAKSTFLLSKIIGDEMLKKPGSPVLNQEAVIGTIKGKIITISDWSVLTRPYEGYLPYNAAKAAVNAVTLSLAKELAPDILVNAIAPGPILAPPELTEEENLEVLAKTPLQRWGGAEEIAKAVLYLFDADFVTGQILAVDGGRTIA